MTELPTNQGKDAESVSAQVRKHLDEALELSDDEEVNYHLREALHLLQA